MKEEHRKVAIKLLGGFCAVCNRRYKNLHVHEKSGKTHNYSLAFVFKHMDRFILLCGSHHDRAQDVIKKLSDE